MRSAVDEILAFNRSFARAPLQRKLERMIASPFTFFRATFHLFAYDLQYKKDGVGIGLWPTLRALLSAICIRKISEPTRRLSRETVHDSGVPSSDESTNW
jgi:hypothetical protein